MVKGNAGPSAPFDRRPRVPSLYFGGWGPDIILRREMVRQGAGRLIVLAIDTSTPRAALALGRFGLASRVAPLEADSSPSRRHGQGLIPAIEGLLLLEGLKVADLGAIAVGLGPGSYTGLRIGLTAAKTLAYAASKPLLALDSLEAIARNAPDDALRVVVAVDAQRGDAYVARFARSSPGSPLLRLGPTTIEPVGPWSEALEPGTVVLGPSLARLLATWPETVHLGTLDQGHPDPSKLIPLAFEALEAARVLDPFFVEPIYMRRSAAEDQWERLGR
jgi:tRNA threonylcarbamoyladenosine biosynthesis protein TsaB